MLDLHVVRRAFVAQVNELIDHDFGVCQLFDEVGQMFCLLPIALMQVADRDGQLCEFLDRLFGLRFESEVVSDLLDSIVNVLHLEKLLSFHALRVEADGSGARLAPSTL